MRRARKLTGILALLALCACAGNQATPTTVPAGTTTGTTDPMGAGTGEPGTGQEKVDCSTVRCAACPTGQHPVLKPPDCCRCVPN